MNFQPTINLTAPTKVNNYFIVQDTTGVFDPMAYPRGYGGPNPTNAADRYQFVYAPFGAVTATTAADLLTSASSTAIAALRSTGYKVVIPEAKDGVYTVWMLLGYNSAQTYTKTTLTITRTGGNDFRQVFSCASAVSFSSHPDTIFYIKAVTETSITVDVDTTGKSGTLIIWYAAKSRMLLRAKGERALAQDISETANACGSCASNEKRIYDRFAWRLAAQIEFSCGNYGGADDLIKQLETYY